jgi:anti-sigma regulatory factor (Ser/Thr protein kinase)
VTTIRRFRCQPGSVSAARRFVRDTLNGQPPAIMDAAELMTSELTANCVRHAHTDFELAIESHGQIRVEVHDSGPGEPRLLSPARGALTGRGLQIVDTLADEWGVTALEDGKAVWFTLRPANDDSS